MNELSLAVSYRQLYLSLSSEDLVQPPSAAADNSSSSSFWQIDEWSEQDKENAEKLLQQSESKCSVTNQRVQHYEREAARNWNKFYQHHGTNFFNDRHYLSKAFPDEFPDSKETRNLVEIGCGVGNSILPLLEEDSTWKVWGYDLAKVAVDLMQKDPRFDPSRAIGGVWDISQDNTPPPVVRVADVVTLLFCLSAIAPGKMEVAVRNVAATLKPGGVLVFRDYGRYDEAQLKLGASRAKRLGDNFYVKSDGTRCFYFTVEHLQQLLVEEAGLEVLEVKYVRRIYQNRAKDEQRRRVWVQGRFRKPL